MNHSGMTGSPLKYPEAQNPLAIPYTYVPSLSPTILSWIVHAYIIGGTMVHTCTTLIRVMKSAGMNGSALYLRVPVSPTLSRQGDDQREEGPSRKKNNHFT